MLKNNFNQNVGRWLDRVPGTKNDDDGKANLVRKDDSTDHNRLIWVLVIAVLIGEHLGQHRVMIAVDGNDDYGVEDGDDYYHDDGEDDDDDDDDDKHVYLYLLLRRHPHDSWGFRF